MSYQIIDLATWQRAEHFKFYSGASQPWFNICAELDATLLSQTCKQQGVSFFHAYLYLTQVAINQHQPFKLRIVGDELRAYNRISISSTVLADDEMMRFCDMPYAEDFDTFCHQAILAQQAAKSRPFVAADFVGQAMAQDVIHLSVIPWISFTSFSNARNTAQADSIPKIIFGKSKETTSGMKMPFSVEVHHGVMDGLQVGRFFETMQTLFNQPELLFS